MYISVIQYFYILQNDSRDKSSYHNYVTIYTLPEFSAPYLWPHAPPHTWKNSL